MLKTAMEVATLIGVAAAVLGGSFYALGTVWYLSYYDALGFDAHLFPWLDSELAVLGFLSGLLPALLLGLVAVFYASVFALSNRAEDWLNRHLASAKWRIPIALVGMVGAIGVAYYFNIATLKQWIIVAIIIFVIIMGAENWGKWVPPVAMCCVTGVVMASLMIKYVGSEAYKSGQKRVAEAGKSRATTIIEFTDGCKIPVPGERIVCSEHFCGFHNGTTATVISLEGVRSIQSPAPQEVPPHTSCK